MAPQASTILFPDISTGGIDSGDDFRMKTLEATPSFILTFVTV